MASLSPLVIIFVTVFIDLLGFGIIIPLLPFYAETFGASPLTIGLLFASFSAAQLVASPLLGHWSDTWGRRPVLILSLIGTVVSFVMLAVAHNLDEFALSTLLVNVVGSFVLGVLGCIPLASIAAIVVGVIAYSKERAGRARPTPS